MMHLGGKLLINYKCLETGSLIFFIEAMSISLTFPSNNGLETIKFIYRILHKETRIFPLLYFCNNEFSAYDASSTYSCHSSTIASGIKTPIGAYINLNPCVSLPPIFYAKSWTFCKLKYILSSSGFALKHSQVAIP